MGRKDMPNEDIERVLREHFKAEASELRAPRDPWDWLQSRLETQAQAFASRKIAGYAPGPVLRGVTKAFSGCSVVAIACRRGRRRGWWWAV